MKVLTSAKRLLKINRIKIYIFSGCIFSFVLLIGVYLIYSIRTYPGTLPSKYEGTIIEDLYISRRPIDGENSLEHVASKWLPVGSNIEEAVNYLQWNGFTIEGIKKHDQGNTSMYLRKHVSTNLFASYQFMITLNFENGIITSSTAQVLRRSL